MTLHRLQRMIFGLLAIILYSCPTLAVGEAAPFQYTKKEDIREYYYPKWYVEQMGKMSITPKANLGSDKSQEVASSLACRVISTGGRYVGKPYRYRVSGHILDCSGLMGFIFGQHGIKLPAGSYNQANKGRKVSRAALAKGDLLFFSSDRGRISHVGVYAGNNKVLHSCNSGIRYDNLSNTKWLNRGFVKAMRVI